MSTVLDSSISRNAIEKISLKKGRKSLKIKETNTKEKYSKQLKEMEKEELTEDLEGGEETPCNKFEEKVPDKVTGSILQETSSTSQFSINTPTPSSCTTKHTFNVSELDAALKQFSRTTAQSREQLSYSHPKTISEIESFETKPLPSKYCIPLDGASWRQRPPPPNTEYDSEWKRLSSSMLSLTNRGEKHRVSNVETNLDTMTPKLCTSNRSLNTETNHSLPKIEQVTRTQSMSRLDSVKVSSGC